MTNWATDDTVNHHPGGPDAITKWTSTGILIFPSHVGWHPMSRWQKFSILPARFGSYVARYGDTIKYEELPIEIQSEAVANSLGANKIENVIGNSGGTLVCGSQGEVAPDPYLEDFFEIRLSDTDTLNTLDRHREQRQTVWIDRALNSQDQLRQKMAWALSQILVVDPGVLTDRR